MSTRTAVCLSCLSAVLLWLASPTVGVGWLAWISIAPAAAVALRSPGSAAARLAVPLAYALYLELLLVPALPFGIAEGQWGDAAVPVMVGDSPVLAVALIAVPAFGALLWLIRFGEPWGAERVGGRAGAVLAVLVPAAAWTGLDLLRAKLDPGGLWGPLFLSQASTPAGGLAALAGPWAITFAIVAVNYSLALAFVRRRVLVAAPAVSAVAAAVLVAQIAWTADDGEPHVRVGAVQPGYDTAQEELPVLRHFDPDTWELAALDLIGDMAPIAREAAARGAELIALPEAAVYLDEPGEPAVLARLRRLARATGATLVVPYFLPGPDRGETVAIAPTGAISGPRPKQRPMWFLAETSVDAEPEPLDVAGLPIGTLLGIDVMDPWIAARLADRGAELLVSSTHDFPGSTPSQRAYTRLAGMAAGVSVVRADWRYASAAYSAAGEVIADTGEGKVRAALVADVPRATVATPYRTIGDVPAWIALGFAAAAAILTALLGRRGDRRSRAARNRPRPASQSAAGHPGEAPPTPSPAARRG